MTKSEHVQALADLMYITKHCSRLQEEPTKLNADQAKLLNAAIIHLSDYIGRMVIQNTPNVTP